MISQVPVPGRVLLNNGIRYLLNSPLRRVNSALQHGRYLKFEQSGCFLIHGHILLTHCIYVTIHTKTYDKVANFILRHRAKYVVRT